jgi:type II secretory pathway pseudopilin PulG
MEPILRGKRGEHGITILLVAVALVAILAMAALAIDVSSLYVAHGEAQRAADAGALAGAQMLVAAGVTADPGNTTLQSTAKNLATQEATNIAQKNLIGGVAPTVNVSFPNSGTSSFGINPQVTVSVSRSSPPVFMGRIWGATVASVSATATAEALNPSNSSSVTGGTAVPVAPKCVKPWMIPNKDPHHALATFITPSTGAITNPGAYATGGVIGEVLMLQSACSVVPSHTDEAACPLSPLPFTVPVTPPQTLDYVVASVPPPSSTILPSCETSSSPYQDSIDACNPTSFTCVGANNGTVDFTSREGLQTKNGLQCLAHSSGSGWDTLDTTLFPSITIHAGSSNPLVEGGTVSTGDIVTSSSSIVTIPIFDGAPITSSGNVNIVGFMQAFVDGSTLGGSTNPYDFNVYVLNISGCGSPSAPTAVVGGATAVPVRLIHP